jgi:hypothetical protein
MPNTDLYLDKSDGGSYCKPCWVACYGKAPTQPAIGAKPKDNTKGKKPDTKGKMCSEELWKALEIRPCVKHRHGCLFF